MTAKPIPLERQQEAQKIADSLRACSGSVDCNRCGFEWGFGCASKLKNDAADMIEWLLSMKSDNVDAFAEGK